MNTLEAEEGQKQTKKKEKKVMSSYHWGRGKYLMLYLGVDRTVCCKIYFSQTQIAGFNAAVRS